MNEPLSNRDSLLQLFKDRVKERDELHLDPQERANLISSILYDALGLKSAADVAKQPIYFDLASFCMEMLSLYAITVDDPDFLLLIKTSSKHFYGVYYSLPNDHEALGPSRDKHKAIYLKDSE